MARLLVYCFSCAVFLSVHGFQTKFSLASLRLPFAFVILLCDFHWLTFQGSHWAASIFRGYLWWFFGCPFVFIQVLCFFVICQSFRCSSPVFNGSEGGSIVFAALHLLSLVFKWLLWFRWVSFVCHMCHLLSWFSIGLIGFSASICFPQLLWIVHRCCCSCSFFPFCCFLCAACLVVIGARGFSFAFLSCPLAVHLII